MYTRMKPKIYMYQELIRGRGEVWTCVQNKRQSKDQVVVFVYHGRKIQCKTFREWVIGLTTSRLVHS